MWFDGTVRMDYRDLDHRLEVAVPNRFVADWVDRHFRVQLQEAARDELDGHVGLDVRVNPDLFTKDQGTSAHRVCVPTPPLSPVRVKGTASGRSEQNLRHNLEDFVVGPSNELAFAAASRLAQEEHATINPLFIHGSCGLGKTHLLQGICLKMRHNRPGQRIWYTTGEQFTNEFLTAMRHNQMERFRKKVRGLDLLAVDDIHFLANKQATQQEFLHSFDAIELSGARVVLASDSHPSLIRQFTEALVSRCVRGMVVPVRQPDATTRAAIIRALAHKRRLLLVDTAVQAIADRCIGSVREIEGILTNLHALASLAADHRSAVRTGAGQKTVAVGRALVDQLFQSKPIHDGRRVIRFEAILAAAIKRMGVDRSQILGNGRHQHVVLARSVVVYLARQMTMMSYPEIAAAMGRRTHSTIITAAKRVEKQLASNPTLVLPATMEQLSLVELIECVKRQVVRV